ncbi:MAG: beta-lactamase family protein [Bacteroidales bacterium]|nr:beta-lactamase family protein [Bacteroidales bacterium]
MTQPTRHKILIRSVLSILFLLVFTYPDKNFGVQSSVDPEILTLNEQKDLSFLFVKDKYNRLESLLTIAQEAYGFHGSVLVAVEGSLVFNKTIGYANFRTKKKLTNESVFQLASVSKQFIAMAIMILKEGGFLSYDDDIQKYLPDFPYKKMTIRHLLNHTAGLPNYMWLIEHYWQQDSIPPDNGDMVRMLSDHDLPLYFTPGRRFDYCNTGYAVLAYLIEVISKKSIPDFLQDNIFDPLEMFNTFAYSTAADKPQEEILNGYSRSWRRYRTIGKSLHDGILGDKGVYSTTSDLFKWDQALYSEKLVSYASLEEAFTAGKVRNKYDFPYGFGFRIKETEEGKVVYHYGRWEGFRTGLLRYIDQKNTIIILNHTSLRGLTIFINRIKKIIHDSPNNRPVELIVEKAFSGGIEYAVATYNNLKKDDPSLAINTTLLLEVVDYLNSINKPGKARLIKELFFTLHNQEEDIIIAGK